MRVDAASVSSPPPAPHTAVCCVLGVLGLAGTSTVRCCMPVGVTVPSPSLPFPSQGLFSVAKPMMSEIFSSNLPSLVTAGFASAYVLALSAGNLGGRLVWAAVSDKVGRRAIFTLFSVGRCAAGRGSTWVGGSCNTAMHLFGTQGGGGLPASPCVPGGCGCALCLCFGIVTCRVCMCVFALCMPAFLCTCRVRTSCGRWWSRGHPWVSLASSPPPSRPSHSWAAHTPSSPRTRYGLLGALAHRL